MRDCQRSASSVGLGRRGRTSRGLVAPAPPRGEGDRRDRASGLGGASFEGAGLVRRAVGKSVPGARGGGGGGGAGARGGGVRGGRGGGAGASAPPRSASGRTASAGSLENRGRSVVPTTEPRAG